MNLELYRIFCTVADIGNILKAADELYLSQPATSRSIKQLEDNLGYRLFVRSSRGVKLTKQGEILYQYARQALTLIKTGEKKVSEYENLSYGEVIIGVSDTLCKYYLTPYLHLFNDKHPNVKIQIRCHNTPETINLLKEGRLDLALVTSPIAEESLTLLPVLQIQDCFVVGEKYQPLARERRHLPEILSYPVLLLTETSNSRQFINAYFRNNNIAVKPTFELGNFDLLAHYARNNFGVACVMRNFVKDDLEHGRLFEIELIEKIPVRTACIAMIRGTEPSPAAKELIKMMS